MPKEDVIAKIDVVFQDPFHLKNLYKLIYIWLNENEYLSAGISEKEMEVLYSEQDHGGVKEYHIWWRTEKQPNNSYFKYKIDIDYLGLGIMNTEVIKNDKKYKMQIGELTMELRATLILEANDTKKKWENNFLMKLARDWFQKKFYRTKIEQHEDQLYDEIYNLQQTIKEYLELKQYEDTPDLFFEKKGFE